MEYTVQVIRWGVLVAALLVPPLAEATTYYVRTDGNNANAGTSNTSGGAWLTWQKAADTMVAGDVTIVADGTYVSGNVNFATAGSAGNPITLRGATTHGAILSSTSSCLAKISINASYITIENIRTQTDAGNVACGSHNSTDGTGVRAFPGSVPALAGTQTTLYHHTVVRNTRHDDCAGECSHSIKVDGDGSLIENNIAYNGIETGMGDSIIARGNQVLGADVFGNGFGCGKFGARNTQCYANYIVCTTAWESVLFIGGVSAEGLHWDPTVGIEAYNSVSYGNVFVLSGSPTPCQVAYYGAQDSLLAYNTIVGNGYQIAFYNGGGSSAPAPISPTIKDITLTATGACLYQGTNFTGTLTFDYNNFRTCTSPPSQTHNVSGDPALDANYVPGAGSVLINAGDAITTWPKYGGGSITLDLNYVAPWMTGRVVGRPFGLGYEVGAREYGLPGGALMMLGIGS